MLIQRHLDGGVGSCTGACWWLRGGALGCVGPLPVVVEATGSGLLAWLWVCVDGVFWYTKHVHYTLVWI
jgi:hypothetical protein